MMIFTKLPVIRASMLACLLGTFTTAQIPQQDAWTTLNGGLNNSSWEKRVKAVSVLGELTGDKKAEAAAINALKDEKEDVRRSAVQSLGEIGAKSAIPQLMEMIRDKEPSFSRPRVRSSRWATSADTTPFMQFSRGKRRPAPA